ncbi:protein prenylyltransferase [Annulohypoxylon truncatum]|uniref:protein prenylyltransferase n=1 Tax=Annulohypoxylon truncatum TaxID=327061 RepID=UPI002007E916|nr:protein prenylyltransferase [Annulohypoxylon truncatum]KAI1214643.1 protein prenylyltransferase [Annulohypoxylon truncatum]
MPKNKGAGGRAKPAESAKQEPPKKPQTIKELEWQWYYDTNPHQKAYEQLGLDGMTPADRQAYLNQEYLKPGLAKTLSNKAQKELWKQLNEANVPLRNLPRPRDNQWGRDKNGRDIGDYTVEEYKAYNAKANRLLSLSEKSWDFKRKHARARDADRFPLSDTEQQYLALTEEDIEVERARRKEMAQLKQELYGTKSDPYALDPDWDDVVPIPQEETEGALAAIAYPDEYAEAMSYLRAVMAVKEYSPRCLKLTERIISLNPAHYTVWIYRFSIIEALNISIPDEIEWLNDIALTYIKNYQIWNHRNHLIDHYYPTIVTSPVDLAALADSEKKFLDEMLELDTKNYHVWSYRQYLVRKLGLWGEAELKSVEALIDDDVRNNSAWSHRFFVVFSDPSYSSPDSHATEYDPKIPADIIDREIEYSKAKILLAPQNQSPWNYLKGVLYKGGRKMGTVREFAEQFVKNLGLEEMERVHSSHALDLLADAYKEAGEKDLARTALKRLGEKWDRIRRGYWEYRITLLDASQP